MQLSSIQAAVAPGLQSRRLGRGWTYAKWSNTREFSRKSKDALFACLVEISTKAFGADMTSYWADRDAGGYFERITNFCLLVDPHGEVAGWTGYHRKRFDDVPCLYLDSSGVVPELQGGGLMSRLHARMITRECLVHAPRAVHLVTRSENPVVYRLLRDGCGEANIWPPVRGPVTRRPSAIATAAAEWLGQLDKLDPSRLILRGAYDNLDALYGDLPSSGDSVTDEFFRSSLRPEDAFVIVARATIPYVMRKLIDRELRVIGRVARRGRVEQIKEPLSD